MKALVLNMPKIWGFKPDVYIDNVDWVWNGGAAKDLIGTVIDVEATPDEHGRHKSHDGRLRWLAEWLDFDSVHEPCPRCGGVLRYEMHTRDEFSGSLYQWFKCWHCKIKEIVRGDTKAEAWEKLDRRVSR